MISKRGIAQRMTSSGPRSPDQKNAMDAIRMRDQHQTKLME
jgi:hypothetical protein